MPKISKMVLYTIYGIIGCIIVLFTLIIFKPEWRLSTKDRQNIRERHIRWERKSNLIEIGRTLEMYAIVENDGVYPDKLSELYPNYVSKVERFFFSDEKKNIMILENIDSLGCFKYLGAGLTKDADPGTILVHEKTNNHLKPIGIHVCFVDNEMEWLEINVPFAVEPLIAVLKDKNNLYRKHAPKALGILKDPRAVEPLIAALKDGDREVRRNAAYALRNLEYPKESLIADLKDENISVRRSTSEALGVPKDPRAVGALKSIEGISK